MAPGSKQFSHSVSWAFKAEPNLRWLLLGEGFGGFPLFSGFDRATPKSRRRPSFSPPGLEPAPGYRKGGLAGKGGLPVTLGRPMESGSRVRCSPHSPGGLFGAVGGGASLGRPIHERLDPVAGYTGARGGDDGKGGDVTARLNQGSEGRSIAANGRRGAAGRGGRGPSGQG